MINQAEIHRKTISDDITERKEAVNQLRSNFAVLPDKKQAWDDLYQLTKDKDSSVWAEAVETLGAAFPYIPDKKQAWKDLIRRTKHRDIYVRMGAARSLGAAFPYTPDKKQAWKDLHRLTKHEDIYIRMGAAISLDAAFPYIHDKKQAWKDIIRLIKDIDISVHFIAVETLGAAFPYIPDKKQAWDELYRLAKDEKSFVRVAAVRSLGAAFPYIPDKKQAWNDMHGLTQESEVRVSANYALGRASIFKATEAVSEENFRKEFENALEFFERASKEAKYFNPAIFCLPFYRSLYMTTFKQTAEAKVEKYLAEAKSATEGSESREKLLEAIENLANALKEVQKVREMPLDTMKCNLNTYRRYCERAAELMKTTKEQAPGATAMLERGMPMIDKRIKELLEEIEEKVKKFCVDSNRTALEKISRSVYGYTKGLGEVVYPLEVEARLNRLSPLLRSICTILPEESRKVICSQLDEIEEADLNYKVIIMESALSSFQVQISNLHEQLAERDRWIEYLKDLVLKRIDTINDRVFKLKLRSEEIVPTLRKIQTELNKLTTIKTDLKNIGSGLTDLGDLQHHALHTLNEEIARLAEEIETKVIPRLPETSDAQRIIEKLQDLKQSKGEVWFNRVAALSSIISVLLTIL